MPPAAVAGAPISAAAAAAAAEARVAAAKVKASACETDEVRAFLEGAGLVAFADELAAFGCDSVADLVDTQVVSDADLASDAIRMKPAQVNKFRKAVRAHLSTASSASWSGAGKEATVAEACGALLAAVGSAHPCWCTLRKILGNIAKSPKEPKYRRLKESNATVQAVWSREAPCRALLVALGFAPLTGEEGGYIDLVQSAAGDRSVEACVAFFDKQGLGVASVDATLSLSSTASGSTLGGGGSSISGSNETKPISSLGEAGLGHESSEGSSGDGGSSAAQVTKASSIKSSASSESKSGAEHVLPETLDLLRMKPSRAEVGAFLGEGSFGVVHRGTYRLEDNNAPPLPVAFKRIKLPGGVSSEVLEALTREVQTMKRLNHPNLLRLYCVNDDPSARDAQGKDLGVCLCLEYCEWGSLRDMLKDSKTHPMPWPQRCALALGIARGMKELYTHVPAIQHRDLKSMNVLVSGPGASVAKVSDFGLARHRETTKMTSSSVHAKGGTFRWAAPETFDGKFTEASDVYSFGITLWELVTRELPYGEMLEQQIMMAVYMRRERPDAALVPPECPQALSLAMNKCWAHDPLERPTFAQVVQLLEPLVSPPAPSSPAAAAAAQGDTADA